MQMVPLKGVVNYQLSIYGLLVLKQLQNQLNFIHLHDHNFKVNDKCRLEGLNLKTFLLYFKYLLFLHFYDFQIRGHSITLFLEEVGRWPVKIHVIHVNKRLLVCKMSTIVQSRG